MPNDSEERRIAGNLQEYLRTRPRLMLTWLDLLEKYVDATERE